MLNNPLDPQQVDSAIVHCQHHFLLQLDDFVVRVGSNNAELITALQDYYRSYPQPVDASAQVQLWMIDQPSIKPEQDWRDWPRETGKSGLKEAIADLPNAERLIYKVKTGMLMLQRPQNPLLIGPAMEHLAQAVNFINNQHLNDLQHQGGLICHAAAMTTDTRGVAVAASSGGGKSTLMLRLMELPQARFITNDRLFVTRTNKGTLAQGVAKLPRVNPGTLLNNARLRSVLSEDHQTEFSALSRDELWQLEFKSDVPVEDYYGAGSLCMRAPLHDLILLNWSHNSDQPCQIRQVDLAQEPHLLPGIMKSPGAFYQDAQGRFLDRPSLPPHADYLQALGGLNVYEVTGRADFDHVADWYLEEILQHD